MDVTKLPAPNHGGRRGGPKATSGKGAGAGKGGGAVTAAAAPAQHSHPSPAAMQVCGTPLSCCMWWCPVSFITSKSVLQLVLRMQPGLLA